MSRRRVALAAVVTVACGLVALPVVAFGSSGKPRSALVFTSVPTTNAAPSLQLGQAADTGTATTVAPTPTTAPPATTQQAATSPSTALACHDSYNAACGTFRWSPAPAAAGPVSANVTYSPAGPVAGESVTFTITYSDPNASVNTTCATIQSGMGMDSGCQPDYTACNTRYGPWDPPAKQPSSGTQTYTFRYDAAGAYTFSVKYPAGNPCYNPYAGQVTGSVSFTVAPNTISTTN